MGRQLLKFLVSLDMICNLETVVVTIRPVMLDELLDLKFAAPFFLPQIGHDELFGTFNERLVPRKEISQPLNLDHQWLITLFILFHINDLIVSKDIFNFKVDVLDLCLL